MTSAPSPTPVGWNTDLAIPFTFVESLPATFTRLPGKRHFSAKSGCFTYWIAVRCIGKFWLNYRNEETHEVRTHYFQTCSGLSKHRVSKAIFKLTAEIHALKKVDALSIDLSDFKAAFSSVRETNSLSDGELPELSGAQVESLRYMLRCIGISGDVMVHSGEGYSASDGTRTVQLGRRLPAPLDMFPSLEVFVDEGHLMDFRESELWEGEVGRPFENILDRMRALNSLAQSGMDAALIDSLDDFVEQLMAEAGV